MRRYGPRLVAETTVEGTDASEARTAPVETAIAGAGRWSMRFFLPSHLTLETVPEPIDPRVRIAEVPGETLAVDLGSFGPSHVGFSAMTGASAEIHDVRTWSLAGATPCEAGASGTDRVVPSAIARASSR